MKSLTVLLVSVAIACLVLAGCCRSITQAVTQTAESDLGCSGDDMKITNVSSQTNRGPAGRTRTLQVECGGKQGRYACTPTNAEEEQNALKLDWRCEPAGG